MNGSQNADPIEGYLNPQGPVVRDAERQVLDPMVAHHMTGDREQKYGQQRGLTNMEIYSRSPSNWALHRCV